MKKILAILLPIVLVTGAIYGYFTFTTQAVMAYVSVDINPSVQFVTDGNDVVVSVTASNDDGETILLGQVENLIGLNIEEATQLIVELAIEYGYLDPEALETDPAAITISTVVENQNERLQNRLRERIRVHLEDFFKNNGIFGVVMTDLDMESIVVEADELGISAGFLKLVRSVQAVYPDLTTEQALNLSTKELMDMLRQVREINNYVDFLQNQITATQTSIDEVNASILTATTNLQAAQDTLSAYELTDTTEYDAEALADYNAQLAIYQEAVTTLQAELDGLNAQLTTLQTTLTNLQTALTDREAHLLMLQTEAQIRKASALQKYNDWKQNKASRAEQVKNRWEAFKNSLTEEQVNNLIDYFQNAWQNR